MLVTEIWDYTGMMLYDLRLHFLLSPWCRRLAVQ